MLLAESTRLLSFYFLLLIKGKLGERRGTSFDRKYLRFARQVLQFRNSIHDKKVTSLMSKKFASACKAQNAAVNSARTHKHSLTCLITSYPHPKQFAIRALKRYSDKQHFFSNRFHPASHSENACILLLRNPESQARSNDQLSHGKKPRV